MRKICKSLPKTHYFSKICTVKFKNRNHKKVCQTCPKMRLTRMIFFKKLENKECKISIFGLQTSRSLGRKEQTKDRQSAAKKRENLLIFHKSSNSALKMRAVRLLNDKHYQLVKKGSHLEVVVTLPLPRRSSWPLWKKIMIMTSKSLEKTWTKKGNHYCLDQWSSIFQLVAK